MLFSLGLSCALRAGQEHRNLRSVPFDSQFTFLQDECGKLYFRYVEDLGMKTNKGGIKQRKIEPKVVNVYQTDNPDRCPVRILMLYMSMLPKNRNCKSLYLKPKTRFTPNSWYFDRPVGINTLREVVKNVCSKGGIPGYYTNHSLRSTSATRMYRDDIEEQLIQEVTGHHSLAVRSYKRTSDTQRREANKAVFAHHLVM